MLHPYVRGHNNLFQQGLHFQHCSWGSYFFELVIAQTHPPRSCIFCRGQTGKLNGDMMGTIASASFRSLLIYTIWKRMHCCFLFSVVAEWQFQCLHFAFCAMRPYCTDQGIIVEVKPSVKYANHNYTFRYCKMTTKWIHGSQQIHSKLNLAQDAIIRRGAIMMVQKSLCLTGLKTSISFCPK